jgi:hypothetical protein
MTAISSQATAPPINTLPSPQPADRRIIPTRKSSRIPIDRGVVKDRRSLGGIEPRSYHVPRRLQPLKHRPYRYLFKKRRGGMYTRIGYQCGAVACQIRHSRCKKFKLTPTVCATLIKSMNLIHMLTELRSERQQLDEAILALQRLATGQGKRRGRPPKWMASAELTSVATVRKRKRRPFSAATRKRMAAAQRRRSAERKAAE